MIDIPSLGYKVAENQRWQFFTCLYLIFLAILAVLAIFSKNGWKKAETGTQKIATSDFVQVYTLKKRYQSWNATTQVNRTRLVSDDIQLHTTIRHHRHHILEETNNHKCCTQPGTTLTPTSHHNICYATWNITPRGKSTRRSRLANSSKIFVFPTSSKRMRKGWEKDEIETEGIHKSVNVAWMSQKSCHIVR